MGPSDRKPGALDKLREDPTIARALQRGERSMHKAGQRAFQRMMDEAFPARVARRRRRLAVVALVVVAVALVTAAVLMR